MPGRRSDWGWVVTHFHPQWQAHPLPQEAAFFAANRCLMACDVRLGTYLPTAGSWFTITNGEARSREALRSGEKTAVERVEAGSCSRAVPNQS
jgi:hypothetical protein